MTPLFDNQEYYRKMLELQEKLRKSEEERIRLEERFNLLEQESRIRHETCINNLRMRYIEFLEEQRLREERNSKLLGALDRVDSNLALMSAKTDKLYSLRKEYEASYASRRQSPSVTGDSGIVSQNEDRKLRKYPQSSPSFPSSASTTSLSTLLHPRKAQSHSSTSNFYPKPLIYPQRPTIDYQPRFQLKSRDLESTWQLGSSHLAAPSYSEQGDPFRRTCRYFPKESSPFRYPETINPLKTTRLTSTLSTPNFDDEKTGNELEKFITKIRSLHGDLDQSLEEGDHEQNTSGDLLNVTLSDDGLDHLPAEEKTKQVPAEIGKVLAIAEDLASRTIKNTSSNPPNNSQNVNSSSQHINLSAINEKHSDIQQSDEMRPIAQDLEIDQSQNAELIHQKISHSNDSPPIEINPNVSDESAENALKVVEEVINNDFAVVEKLEPWRPAVEAHVDKVLINQEDSITVPETDDVDKNNDINEDKDKLEMGGNRDAAEVKQQDVNLVNDGGDKPQNTDDQVTYQENYQIETQEGVEQYPEGDYQEPSAGYDYSHQGDGYQYVDGQYQYNQAYNYDENGQVVEGTYPEGASENYQTENYDPNTEYAAENYPEGSDVQYTPENYAQDPNSQYQAVNYDPNDPNAQYQGENYPQEGNQYEYENSNQQYQGDQGYDASNNYGYSYEQEGYQTEIPGDETDQVNVSEQPLEQLEASVEGSSVRDEENINEGNKKKKDVIKSILESETESISIERNTSNTESDFDFN